MKNKMYNKIQITYCSANNLIMTKQQTFFCYLSLLYTMEIGDCAGFKF